MSHMSTFFEKSDVSRKEAESIISDTLQKCDDGELYLENSKSESIILDDNKSIFDISDLILKVKEPIEEEYSLIKENQIVFKFV